MNTASRPNILHQAALALALIVSFLTLTAHAAPKKYPYQVTTTVGMITDVVRNVAGDKAQVDGLIGEGIDPHLYKPTRADLIALRRANIIFYNGLMLEGKMADVLLKIARNKPVYAVTDGIEDLPAVDLEGLQTQLDAANAEYQSMMGKLQEAMTKVALQEPNARLIDKTAPASVKGPDGYRSAASIQVLRPDDQSTEAHLVAAEADLNSLTVVQAVEERLTKQEQAALVAPYDNQSVEAILRQNRKATRMRDTWVLSIAYTHPDDAALAAKVANLFADEFINLNVKKNIELAMKTVEKDRLLVEKQRAKVEGIRKELKQAREQYQREAAGSYVMSDEAEHYDPHVWMDVRGWIQATKVVEKALAEFDPKNAAYYQKNAQTFIAELEKLDAYAKEVISSIPVTQRWLVTAHDAFNYMGRAYGLEVRGIQGLSTESEAGVRDIEILVDFLVKNKIPAVFVETSVSDKNVRALIEGAKARGHTLVIGGELFSDAMGAPGTYEGTYIGMIDHNATTIARALGGQAPAKGMNGQLSGAH